MKEKLVVIGSGVSGVHFALSVLKKGYGVIMVDAGYAGPPPVNSSGTVYDLKQSLADPAEYFLGSNYEAVIPPGSLNEYYGFPPSKSYVFKRPAAFEWVADGFAPLFSFSRGGLAETWKASVYPFNDDELRDLPFSYNDLEPYYAEAAARIGVAGALDDLARFYPAHPNLLEPLQLDEHSNELLQSYEKNKRHLNEMNCYLGRSRLAVLSVDKNGRQACTYMGRCLWGCPSGSLYTPFLTLKECLQYSNFTYVPNVYVRHFQLDHSGRIRHVMGERLETGETFRIEADRFILAAGTLSSSKIFMESLWKARGEIIQLTGLMDNRQVLIPFVNLNLIGVKYNPATYQYHQIAMGILAGEPRKYFHALITTLKSALIHPILERMPFDLRSSVRIFRNVRAALGIVNLNFPDSRRECNQVTLDPDSVSGHSKLVIQYSPHKNEKNVMKTVIQIVKKSLWRLGCVVPPGTIHVRPMGASVHYAGTIPMSVEKRPYRTSPLGQSYDIENLYFVDGTVFPSLPAKNLTFTLMANAIRVADHAF